MIKKLSLPMKVAIGAAVFLLLAFMWQLSIQNGSLNKKAASGTIEPRDTSPVSLENAGMKLQAIQAQVKAGMLSPADAKLQIDALTARVVPPTPPVVVPKKKS